MMNSNYAPEIATAHQFIIDHNYDSELRIFIRDMQNSPNLRHSDKWSIIYDWMKEHYPEATGSIITGLVYYTEG